MNESFNVNGFSSAHPSSSQCAVVRLYANGENEEPFFDSLEGASVTCELMNE